MDGHRRGLSIPGGDPVREYAPEEERALTLNLRALLEDVHGGRYEGRPVDIGLIRELHARLFHEVRDHAGKHRSRYFGSERLTFGPHRSEDRSRVPEEMEKLLQRVRRQLDELLAACPPERRNAEYVEASIRVVAQAHADMVRIHPFEDGNGRTSRALMSCLLLRLGLKPIAVEVPKQEYIDCMNRYFTSRDMEPLVDLYIGLYPES